MKQKICTMNCGPALSVTRTQAERIAKCEDCAEVERGMEETMEEKHTLRALRLADDAAESVICTEGHSPAAYHWVLTHEQIAADPYLGDCIAHLELRGIARRFDAADGVTVIFEEQP